MFLAIQICENKFEEMGCLFSVLIHTDILNVIESVVVFDRTIHQRILINFNFHQQSLIQILHYLHKLLLNCWLHLQFMQFLTEIQPKLERRIR